MSFLLTILFFIIIISVVVAVHEFGHFITAKFFKMTVNEFAIGFGKRLFSKKYKGTIYAIRVIPFGGFVELEGEHSSTDPDNFRNRPFYQKAVVLVAGVTMNIVLAIVLLIIYLSSHNYTFVVPNLTSYTFSNTITQESYYPINVAKVEENGRSKGILNAGDVIVEINNSKFQSYDEFISILKENQNKKISFKFLNIDSYDTYTQEIKIGQQNSNGAILDAVLSPSSTQIYVIKYNKNVSSGISMTYDVFVYQAKALGSLVKQGSVTGDYSELSKSVGGLPQITDQINLAVQYNSLEYLIPLTAFISISLAFFNILPFPALDGGQLLISLVETVRRKKISDEILNKINLTGFAILIILAVIVNLKDVIQLGWINELIQIINNVLGR